MCELIAFFLLQLLEAATVQHIFMNNYQLCTEISETVLHHFIHCLATHGRHVQYLEFLHTIIKAEGKYVKKCQDMTMTEVGLLHCSPHRTMVIMILVHSDTNSLPLSLVPLPSLSL